HALSPSELARLPALGESVARDARCLDALPIPATLLHGDFHAGNVILADGSHPVILDWTDGALSHPFFDLLTFCRSEPAGRWDRASLEGITRAYLQTWTEAGLASAGDVSAAYLAAQRLAPLYHAVSYGRILEIDGRAAAEFAAAVPWFLRILLEGYGPMPLQP